MNKDTVRTLFCLLLGVIGGLLIGFNAGNLSNRLNAILFVIGIVLVSNATTLVGLLSTIGKRKNPTQEK